MASYTVNFALIGCDGQGKTDSGELVAGGQTMVARCDVDFGYVDREVANLVRRGLMPARLEALPDNVQLDGGGAIFIGEKGIFVHGTYAARPRLYPESLMEVAAKVPKTYFRVEKSGDSPMAEARHRMNWINAIKGKEKATCPFEYASRLTETMRLGVVAMKTGQSKKIYYDGDKGVITNNSDANQYWQREYRKGWTL